VPRGVILAAQSFQLFCFVTHLLPRRRVFRILVIGVTYEPTNGRLHTPKLAYLASEGAHGWRLK